MVDVPVNGRVLAWARDERGLSPEKAAQLLKITVAQLKRFEDGVEPLTLGQLEKMAARYKLPVATLLMPEPLSFETKRKVADFRTFGGKAPVFDLPLTSALEAVDAQVELLADIRDVAPHIFGHVDIPAYEPANAEVMAAKERERLGITINEQLGWDTEAQAFRRWRTVIERTGVFVRIINLGEESLCRGFAIYDERQIAVAIINGDESLAAPRIFSLLHEYGHILIRKPGLSDHNRKSAVERFCNQFAAAFLLPREPFRELALEQRGVGTVWTDTVIRRIAEQFKVSMSAVALRLEEAGLASEGFYEAKLSEWRRFNKKKRKGGPPMTYAERQVNRLGVRHVAVVLDAVGARHINALDAYELTDVKPGHYPDLKREIENRQAAYGVVR